MEFENVKMIKEEDSQAHEDEKINKSIQAYKQTVTLIKSKMNKADILIRQYNDKMKECDVLTEEITKIKNEKQDILNKYNLSMEKFTKLELTNIDYKQTAEKYKSIVDIQQIKLDENEKHIHQLHYKIKDVEEQNSRLQDDIKQLKNDLKNTKTSAKTIEKKSALQLKQQASQTDPEERDFSANIDLIKPLPVKPEKSNKSIMTDECISMYNDPFPIFCTKCKMHITPAPVEKVLKIMTSQPPLLSKISSPSRTSKLIESNGNISEPNESDIDDSEENNKWKNLLKINKDNDVKNVESTCSSFMEIDKLSRKIKKLENLMKNSKTKNKLQNCCHVNSCPSKNIKFIVKLPNEKKCFEYRKREKRKSVKRLNNLKIKINKKYNLENNKWQIEDCLESSKQKQKNGKRLTKKKIKFTSQKNEVDSFEQSEIFTPDIRTNISSNYASDESLSPSKFSDLQPLHISSGIMEANLSINEKALDVNTKNSIVNSEIVSCKAPSQSLVSKNIYENENVEKVNNTVNEISKKSAFKTDVYIRPEENEVLISNKNIQKRNPLSTQFAQVPSNEMDFKKGESEGKNSVEENTTRDDNENSIIFIDSCNSINDNIYQGSAEETNKLETNTNTNFIKINAKNNFKNKIASLLNEESPIIKKNSISSNHEQVLDYSLFTEKSNDIVKIDRNIFPRSSKTNLSDEEINNFNVLIDKSSNNNSSASICENICDSTVKQINKNNQNYIDYEMLEEVNVNQTLDDKNNINENICKAIENTIQYNLTSDNDVQKSNLFNLSFVNSLQDKKNSWIEKGKKSSENVSTEKLDISLTEKELSKISNSASESIHLEVHDGTVKKKDEDVIINNESRKKTCKNLDLLPINLQNFEKCNYNLSEISADKTDENSTFTEISCYILNTDERKSCPLTSSILDESEHTDNQENEKIIKYISQENFLKDQKKILPIISSNFDNYKQSSFSDTIEIQPDDTSKTCHILPITVQKIEICKQKSDSINYNNTSLSCQVQHNKFDIKQNIPEIEQNKNTYKICTSINPISNCKTLLELKAFHKCSFHYENKKNENIERESNNYMNLQGLIVQEQIIEKDKTEDDISIKNMQDNHNIEISNFDENITSAEQAPEIIKEVHSSDESSESKFFSTKIKRGKQNNSSNIIFSDESSAEKDIEIESVRKRKKINVNARSNLAVMNRKKSSIQIRNINEVSKNAMIFNKSESSTSRIIEETSSDSQKNFNTKLLNNSNTSFDDTSVYIPSKKQRIAHTPKSIDDTIKNSKPYEQFKSMKKNRKSVVKNETKQCTDKITSLLEEYDKTCKERIEISRNLKANKPTTSTPIKNVLLTRLINNFSKIDEDSIKSDGANVSPQSLILRKTKGNKQISLNDNTDINNSLIINKEDCKSQNATPTKKIKAEKIIDSSNEDTSPIKELRSRQVVINNDNSCVKKLQVKKQTIVKYIDETNSRIHKSVMVPFLNEYFKKQTEINPNKSRQKMEIANKFEYNDKFIRGQLSLLIDKENWTNEINLQVTQNILKIHDLKTIALVIINYAGDKLSNKEDFDKSHTPPAPMLTRSEQKLITLILSINKIHPEFSDIVIEGIEFKILRYGSPSLVQIVERLFRILVVLSKIKKDREKVRMFCCDALYMLKLRAINIIYVALTCWPEVLPKHDSNNDIIVKTIVHIIMTLQFDKSYAKLISLRKLLSTYYEYPNAGYMINFFKEELLKKVQENVPGSNTATLILCKKMGPIWSLENVVKVLKHMIVNHSSNTSLYEALNLLGNILRSFPLSDPNNSVSEIIDQLCDVLASNAGTDDLQEGVVSCLLSISKFKFEQIARSVIKWQSNKDLRPATKVKLYSFIKQHTAVWWWKFVKTNFPLSK